VNFPPLLSVKSNFHAWFLLFGPIRFCYIFVLQLFILGKIGGGGIASLQKFRVEVLAVEVTTSAPGRSCYFAEGSITGRNQTFRRGGAAGATCYLLRLAFPA